MNIEQYCDLPYAPSAAEVGEMMRSAARQYNTLQGMLGRGEYVDEQALIAAEDRVRDMAERLTVVSDDDENFVAYFLSGDRPANPDDIGENTNPFPPAIVELDIGQQIFIANLIAADASRRAREEQTPRGYFERAADVSYGGSAGDDGWPPSLPAIESWNSDSDGYGYLESDRDEVDGSEPDQEAFWGEGVDDRPAPLPAFDLSPDRTFGSAGVPHRNEDFLDERVDGHPAPLLPEVKPLSDRDPRFSGAGVPQGASVRRPGGLRWLLGREPRVRGGARVHPARAEVARIENLRQDRAADPMRAPDPRPELDMDRIQTIAEEYGIDSGHLAQFAERTQDHSDDLGRAIYCMRCYLHFLDSARKNRDEEGARIFSTGVVHNMAAVAMQISDNRSRRNLTGGRSLTPTAQVFERLVADEGGNAIIAWRDAGIDPLLEWRAPASWNGLKYDFIGDVPQPAGYHPVNGNANDAWIASARRLDMALEKCGVARPTS